MARSGRVEVNARIGALASKQHIIQHDHSGVAARARIKKRLPVIASTPRELLPVFSASAQLVPVAGASSGQKFMMA